MLKGIGSWMVGAVMALISLFGMIMAAHAHDDVFYVSGLILFAFGILWIYAMILRWKG